MILPFLSDIVFVGVSAICMLFVLLLIVDGLLQERASRRERQAKAAMANSRQPHSSGNWMASGKLKTSCRHLAVLFACSVVITALTKVNGGAKASATTKAVVPRAKQLSNNASPNKAAGEQLDTNSVIFQYQPPTLGTNLKTIATTVISVDLFSTTAHANIFGKLPRQ